MSIPVDETENYNPRIKRGVRIIAEPLNVYKLVQRLNKLPQDMIVKIIAPDDKEYCINSVLFEDDTCVSLKLIPLKPDDEILK